MKQRWQILARDYVDLVECNMELEIHPEWEPISVWLDERDLPSDRPVTVFMKTRIDDE